MKHSFERYCEDYQDIENYDKALKDNFVGWECHHRLETHTPKKLGEAHKGNAYAKGKRW